jgi:hypothetical protein
MVSSSKVEEFFLDVSNLEEKTTPLSRNFGQQLVSDATPHSRRTETTAMSLSKPKNAHKLILCIKSSVRLRGGELLHKMSD